VELKPREILAPNASPLTMAGTITYLIGTKQVAIIDPGSDAPSHLDAVEAEIGDFSEARILLTHDHPDHATGARELARRLDCRVFSFTTGTLRDGATFPTDEGELVTLHTPGHAQDHASFHWPEANAVFCGDLMMGGMDTAVVAAPEGDIGLYLDSLERLRVLQPHAIYPAHGPAFKEPEVALARYVRHREERARQVLAALESGARSPEEITDHVYGTMMHDDLRRFGVAAVKAYVAHLYHTGRLPADRET
jgi:hydroxyacylglutathione hydrolase